MVSKPLPRRPLDPSVFTNFWKTFRVGCQPGLKEEPKMQELLTESKVPLYLLIVQELEQLIGFSREHMLNNSIPHGKGCPASIWGKPCGALNIKVSILKLVQGSHQLCTMVWWLSFCHFMGTDSNLRNIFFSRILDKSSRILLYLNINHFTTYQGSKHHLLQFTILNHCKIQKTSLSLYLSKFSKRTNSLKEVILYLLIFILYVIYERYITQFVFPITFIEKTNR